MVSGPLGDGASRNPEVLSEEVPGLLEQLSEVPNPADPRGVRQAVVVVLALTVCAVPAGATSKANQAPGVLRSVRDVKAPAPPASSRPSRVRRPRRAARQQADHAQRLGRGCRFDLSPGVAWGAFS